jgi:hypothetical protein
VLEEDLEDTYEVVVPCELSEREERVDELLGVDSPAKERLFRREVEEVPGGGIARLSVLLLPADSEEIARGPARS